ncbi:LCP family protein [Saccharopolyspora sp. WRP15-2]|uniref:LCP family protein n=1 Tax=Saccharopolyspora oryzae TaxID=2997343 RepID=A0ABT4V1Q6_9PSEU|nr:LCP family protein [Saccharopolyspora oryzae]MDA3627880.1 LCP family protein [Saccharopolyspora oryzae]
MPQDPRHGEVGHRRSRPEADADDGSAATGRRRRALSEDGTGGTRVIDLLSKHGKAPGGSNHRRAAEPEPPQPQPPRNTRPPQPGPAAPPEASEPASRPPEAAPRRRQAPPNRPGTPPPGWTPPAGGRPPQPPARRQDTPPPPSRRPAAGGAAAAFAGGAAARGGRPDEPPVNGGPRNGAPVEPPRGAAPAEPPRGAAPAKPPVNGTPAEPPRNDVEATQISQALSGAPASPPRRMRQPAPKRPVPPPVNEDLEATTQHAPVPPAPPKAEATSVVSRLNPEEQATTFAKPVTPPKRKPAAPVNAAEETAIVAAPDDLSDLVDDDEFDDLDEDLEADEESSEERQADIKQIDATLARFSAVHDEIAAEEEARRKKFSWLLGKRKEPELGTDMPFDFHDEEGRGGQSRMEWKKKQRKRRTNLIVMAVAVAASLSVFLTLGFAWGATTFWGPSSIAALDPNSDSIKDVAKQTGDQNFLLVGSDTRAGARPEDGVGTEEESAGARADTTMIAHIPADRSRVVLVSFPRDLQVDMPACERWDAKTGQYTGQQVPARQDVRLNEAYAVGGPLCTTKVVQQISGLRVDSFLGIDFNGFKSMVDAVQGVEVCTEKPIIDDTLGTVIPEAGKHTISGEQALSYVRARHVQGDPTSDYGRMQRQQMFLSALLRKTMSGQVLLDPGKLSNFVKAVSANTFGENIGADRLMDLGQQLQGLDPKKVTFITVPTTGYANDEGMEVLREDDTRALFQSILDDQPVTTDAQPQQAANTQNLPSGGGASFHPAKPSDGEEPPPATGLSTVNAGTDLCG